MAEKAVDRRVRRTKRAIREALLQLIVEKPVTQVNERSPAGTCEKRVIRK